MSNGQQSSESGAERVLAPVLERLRAESEVSLRLAREDFAREVAELQRRHQVAFAVAFTVFLVLSIVMLGASYFAMRGILKEAEAQSERQSSAVRRLDALEEEAQARIEELSALERRLRVQLLEKPAPPEPESGEVEETAAPNAAKPAPGGAKSPPPASKQ